MRDVRLIALDLDGTLLNSEKELTPRSRAALEAASRAGIEIVPATGRFYRGMPEAVRALPFVRYAITINGAQVVDAKSGGTVYSADISTDDSVSFLSYLDTLPVIYDCYSEGWGYMTEAMQRAAADYIDYAPSLDMVRRLRSPVPELKAFLRETGRRAQKFQLFSRDRALQDELLKTLPEKFPQFAISASLPNNVEINDRGADKGRALRELSRHLGLDVSQTMAFGDGLNDLTMLRAAGTGVAMENGHPDVKAAADRIAPDCDSDGAAQIIEEYLLHETGGKP
ncbi:MAG: HAD family phosphatase [Oscillospiraceae bacterium]|nr:HAD family phosphatase [Oscillospiraceae bacterium]